MVNLLSFLHPRASRHTSSAGRLACRDHGVNTDEPKASRKQEPLAAYRLFPPVGLPGYSSSPHVEVSFATARRQSRSSPCCPQAAWQVDEGTDGSRHRAGRRTTTWQ